MVVFLREQNAVDPVDDDEFIYVNRDEKKEKDIEMEMMTPILLDSMFEFSPPDIHRVIKQSKHIMDHPDDATEATIETLSALYLPSLETSPRATNVGSHMDDDSSELTLDSYDQRVRLSSRGIVSNNYHFNIPADVKFEGDVLFSFASNSQEINLKFRQSAQLNSIFNERRTFGEDDGFYGIYSLADSISYDTYDRAFDESGGAEECKDDFDLRNDLSHDEGFAYVMGSRHKEDDYWGVYNGHYGSRDFEDHNEQADYAVDHESVQGISPRPSSLSSMKLMHSPDESRSCVDEMQDMVLTFFSCGV